MKTIIALAIVMIATISAFAQNSEPTAMTFQNSGVLAGNRNQTHFYRGWNIVDGPRALSQRYNMNISHINLFNARWHFINQPQHFPLLNMPDSSEVIYILDSLQWQSTGPLDATCMMWYPWLPAITDDSFTPYKNDKSGASLPFLTRNTTIGQVDSTTESGNQIYRWRLNQNTSVTTPVVAFSNPWLGNEFEYKSDPRYPDKNSPNNQDTNRQKYDTRKCYVTINLRRSLVTDVDINNNDPILIIKVPYHTPTSTGYMSFDSVPVQYYNNGSWSKPRGLQRRLQFNTNSNLTEFVITRKMIPVGNATDRDVTISAFFWADSLSSHGYFNPRFGKRWGGSYPLWVDTLGIEVQYIPSSTSVSVRSVKVETQSAQWLFWGNRDNDIIDCVNMQTGLLQQLNTLNQRSYRIKRFYSLEEFTAAQWQAERYFNLMVDTLAACEWDLVHVPQAQHTMMFKDNWRGATFTIRSDIAAPYCNNDPNGYSGEEELSRRMGIGGRHGYVKMASCGCQVKKHEDYELAIHKKYDNNYAYQESDILSLPLPLMSEEDYVNNVAKSASGSVQQAYESNFDLNEMFKSTSYIFSKQKWWANCWLSPQFDYKYVVDTLPSPYYFRTPVYQSHMRVQTGEEAKLNMWSNLILGAKGFLIYGGHGANRYFFITNASTGTANQSVDMGIAPIDYDAEPMTNVTTDPNAIINSPDFGTDYLDCPPTRNDRFSRTLRQYFHYTDDEYRAKMRMPFVYMGFKTLRYTVDTIFRKIQTFDTTLLKLQLSSWYAKGLRKHLLGDTALYSKFISLDSTRYGTKTFNRYYLPAKTDSYDSSLFDITLLKHENYATDSVIFIGVQNRRTNALYISSPDGNQLDTNFAPMIEYENHTSTNYGNQYVENGQNTYGQIGARKLKIPFNYQSPDGYTRMLHIQELGGGLDTMVSITSTLVLPMKPGEGKILKVSVVKVSAYVGTGNLMNSNQRKLVRYPVTYYDTATHQLVNTNNVRYHSVYHRYDSAQQRYSVFYRRSIPYSATDNVLNGIDWEGERQLDTIGILMQDASLKRLHCSYPVITVREVPAVLPDTPSIKVFVFYACEHDSLSTVIHLVENSYSAEGNQITNPAREIESTDGQRWFNNAWMTTDAFLSKWGAPAINASANGNYYAWSDTSLGIVVRWKPSTSNLFSNGGSIRESFKYSNDTSVICLHPCLNTYSRIGLGERDAAIVWEEKSTPQAPNSMIAYTMLRPRGNSIDTIEHYLPGNLTFDTRFRSTVKSDSTIVLLNETPNSNDNTFPMIYRGIEESADGSRIKPISVDHWDRIVWESKPEGGRSFIATRGIDYSDSWNGAPSYWAVWWLNTVTSQYTSLHHPQISQGGRNFLFPKNGIYYDDSTVVTNFDVDPYFDFFGGGFLLFPTMYQVIYGYWSFMPNNPSIHWPQIYPANLQWINSGRNPRLSASHSILNQNIWHDNRRIHSSLFNDGILSSAELFYKKSKMEDIQPVHWTGFQFLSGRKAMFAHPEINGVMLDMKAQDDNEGQLKGNQYDTLKSNWFKVGNNVVLNSLAKGIYNPCFRMILENKTNRQNKVVIPYSTKNNDEKFKNTFRLLRGGNEEYRLLVLNSCGNNVTYTEEIQIDGIIPDEQLGKESESTEVITVDLGKELQHENVLTVTPNPAVNEIDIKFTGLLEDIETSNFDYSYVVTDALGRAMEKGLIRAGNNLHVNTSTFVSGTYYVRVKGSVNTVSVPFVIIR